MLRKKINCFMGWIPVANRGPQNLRDPFPTHCSVSSALNTRPWPILQNGLAPASPHQLVDSPLTHYTWHIFHSWPAPSLYLNQCWNTWIIRSKFQWNQNQNSFIFIQENEFGNVVWKMAAILSRSQYVKRAIDNNWAECWNTSLIEWQRCFSWCLTAVM